MMRTLSKEELESVNGTGWLKDLVDDIRDADYKGAYETVVGAVSHVIERVAEAIK